MSNPRNFRRESTGQRTFKGETSSGQPVEFTYSSGSASAHDEDCRRCGDTYTVKGIEGAILDYMVGDLCPKCREDIRCPECGQITGEYKGGTGRQMNGCDGDASWLECSDCGHVWGEE